MIYIIKQAGLYQNKVNSSLISNCNCKMGYCFEKVNLKNQYSIGPCKGIQDSLGIWIPHLRFQFSGNGFWNLFP